MSKNSFLVTVFGLLGFVSVAPGATAAVVTYPLTCTFSGVDSASWGPSFAGTPTFIAGVAFKHSDKAATAGVPEGYCAWADRGMVAAEPTILAQELPNLTQIYEITFKGMPSLVSAPTYWVAATKVKGKQITFQVHATTVPGIAAPVLKIE